MLCPSVVGGSSRVKSGGWVKWPSHGAVMRQSMLNPLSLLMEILAVGFSIRDHMEEICLSVWHTLLRYFYVVTTPPCKKAA